MSSVKKAKTAYIIYSAALILLGLVMIIVPNISTQVLCYIIGGLVLACGIIKFIGYFVKDTYELAFRFDFALGIFTIIIGLLLLFHTQAMLSLINVIIGVFILIDGVFKLQTAKEAQQFGIRHWWQILILAIITSLMGLWLIFEPTKGVIAVTVVIGVALVIDGIENLWVALCTIKYINRREPIEIEAEFSDK